MSDDVRGAAERLPMFPEIDKITGPQGWCPAIPKHEQHVGGVAMSERDSICASEEKLVPQLVAGTEFSRLVNRKTRKPSTVLWATFICPCGVKFTAAMSSVRSRHTASCGCLSSRNGWTNRTHGKSTARVYKIWAGMVKRCYNSAYKDFGNYGGRGIEVCSRWRNSFEAFYDDMGEPPTARHTLDRINNNGHYEPENVRWATYIQQARNMRSNRLITANGETLTLAEWAERLGVNRSLLQGRLKRGWSDQQTVDGTKHWRNVT